MAETEDLAKESPGSAEVINLRGGSLASVEAELVRIHQGGANRIVASDVEIYQGGAASIQADSLAMHQVGAAIVQGNLISAQGSYIGGAVADELGLHDTHAGVAIGRSVEMKDSSALLVLAGEVHGSVEPILDARRAALAGLVAGVAVGLVLFVGSLLTRNRR